MSGSDSVVEPPAPAQPPSRAARVWRRTRVGGSLAAAVALALWAASGDAGPILVLLIALALSVGAVLEGRRMGLFGDPEDARGTLAAAVAVVCGGLVAYGVLQPSSGARVPELGAQARYWIAVFAVPAVALIAALVALLPALHEGGAALGPDGGSPRAVLSYAGAVLWVAVPLTLLVPVQLAAGLSGLAVLVTVSKVGDVAAYYGGSLLGERFPHHPFPEVSPNKTSVGCWCSLIAATAAGGLAQAFGFLPEARAGVLSGLAAGAVVNVAAQAGDLLESAAKRRAGVKDSGTLFGPSGGFLDLVDSLLLSVPAAALAWPLLFHMPEGT